VLPPGATEHGYDPSPKQIARLHGAKLGIAVGLELDTWVEDVMKHAGGVPKLVRVGDTVPAIPITLGHDHAHGHEHDHALGAPDPHVWLDPRRMVTITGAIAAELVALDPDGAPTFTANADAIEASLAALDHELVARSKAWTKRTIVTFHGSMAYFAARYGLRIAAVVEPIAGKAPTATYLAEVIETIERTGAAALFIEPQLDHAAGEIIAREAGVPLGELDPIGGVDGRDSYEALLRWNADQLDEVLK
jgi:zinc transport system substrate-binding protein